MLKRGVRTHCPLLTWGRQAEVLAELEGFADKFVRFTFLPHNSILGQHVKYEKGIGKGSRLREAVYPRVRFAPRFGDDIVSGPLFAHL